MWLMGVGAASVVAHAIEAALGWCPGPEGDAMKWRIGKVTVTKIVELEVTGGSRFILPQATYEEI